MKPILMIVGPTAVGKTEWVLDLAEKTGAEIVSADSRQIFKELNIGTAKPTAEELNRVKHHFIAEHSLNTPYSAGIFAREANARLEMLISNGVTPIVTGGSTLYINALIEGLADIPEIPASVRRHVEDRLREEGASTLYDWLKERDPIFASSMDPTKTQRLVRGVEVLEHTGQPISKFHAEQSPPVFTFDVRVLERPREELYARINARVDTMLGDGLLDEVRSLLESGFDPSLNALRTIGYQEPIAFLKGEIDHEEMVRLIKRNTRRYAKRQITWFRRYPEHIQISS